MRLHTIGNYMTTARYDFLKSVESDIPHAYVDPVGIPTIGIGINLGTHGRLILKALGFDLDGSQLSGAAWTAEQGYINDLLTEFGRKFGARDISLQNRAFLTFNGILQRRASDSVYPGPSTFPRVTEFKVAAASARQALLNQTLDGYSVPGASSTGYETLLNTWLSLSGVSAGRPELLSPNSRERLTLLSLAFNSRVHQVDEPSTSWNDIGMPTLLGPRLASALRNDDRGEAWFEIRYESGSDARRRFLEADAFGIYNDNATEVDFKAAYRVYARHKSRMVAYEAVNQSGLNDAISLGGPLGIPVQNLTGNLQPARNYLTSIYGWGVAINGDILVGEDDGATSGLDTRYLRGTDSDQNLTGTVQNDLIFGESGQDTLKGDYGNDVLYGGRGDDKLEGGPGADILIGGPGLDDYIWNAGESPAEDRVIDEDGLGFLIFKDANGNSTPLSGVYLQTGPGDWVNLDDGSKVLTHHSPWTIVLPGGGTINLGDDFQEGNLGVRLVSDLTTTVPQEPTTGNTIQGDLQPIDFDPDPNQVEYHYDALDNIVTDPNTPEPDRADILHDSVGNDRILAGGGADFIDASRGGDDVIDAGAGDDTVHAGTGNDYVLGGAGNDYIRTQDDNDFLDGGAGDDQLNAGGGADWLRGGTGRDVLRGDMDLVEAPGAPDVLEGGADADVLYGSGGDDYLYGDQVIALTDAVAQGSTDTGSPDRGDFLQGMDGKDVAVGTVAKDLLAGGEGQDILVGGAGDDFLSGDAFYDDIDANWTVTVQAQGSTYTFVVNGAAYTEGAGAGDSIYAGAGNDGILAGGGDDFVFGDVGDDIEVGGAGADSLVGDDGDDVLIGDNSTSVVAEAQHGNDFLSGGAGTDTLAGDGGNDTLFGGTGNDTLYGDSSEIQTGGADYLDGGDGDDTLIGAGGADGLFGGAGADQLYGDADDVAVADQGADYLDGGAGNDFLRGYSGSDTLVGGADADQLFGDIGDDSLDGGTGNDILVGGAGNDELLGGDDNDQLFGDADNVAIADQGDDRLDGGAGDDFLQGYRGNDQLIGGDGADQLFGQEGDDYLDGGAGANTLVGGAGSDALYGGDGDDQLDADGTDVAAADQGDDFIDGGAGNDTLWGHGGADQLYGGVGIDAIDAGDGDDYLDGGAGGDSFWGGLGDDTYAVDDATDFVTENAGEGADEVLSLVSYTLTANVENLALTGEDAVNGTGNALDNIITGNIAANTLTGGGGNDTLAGDLGNDTYAFSLGAGQDVIQETGPVADQNRVLLGPGITLGMVTPSHSGDDVLLTVSGGTDQMRIEGWFTDRKGLVDEVRFIDNSFISLRAVFNNAPTVATPIADQPATEDSAFQFTVLAATFTDDEWDQLTLSATRADGSALPSWLSFDVPSRTFSGTPANADVGTLSVRVTATDAYDASVFDTFDITVTNVNDAPVVATPISDQTAREQSPFAFTVPAATFTDVDAGDSLSYSAARPDGSALPSWLAFDGPTRTFTGTPPTGSAGAVQVRVTATDQSSATAADDFTIDVSSGTYVGTAGPDVLVGSAYPDVLYGLAGNDRLDGAGDADTMYGGPDNDTYVVDQAGDVVVENASEGVDTVESAISYTLGANLENLTLTGTASINATGNGVANTLTGNSGANRLDGGAGADSMSGGDGNDTYVVDGAGDTVTENLNQGTDTVESAITYTLGPNVENLTLTGTASIDGTGNALANVITGNAGANRLDGGAGVDTLAGGAGDDTYVSDTWDDVISESPGGGVDTVVSSDSYALPANVENITLIGDGGFAYGNELDNVMINLALFDSVLDGKEGADTMIGNPDASSGNQYWVDNPGDVVIAGDGWDMVWVMFSYVMPAGVDDLMLMTPDDSPTDGTGNALDNYIQGTVFANVIDGGLGADHMEGDLGADTYIVDNPGDVVVDFRDFDPDDGAIDTVLSSVTFPLPAFVENLTLTGTGTINGTGNSLPNVIRGNSAANTLAGGGGNDSYYVSTGDTVTENSGGGTDTVYTDVTLPPLGGNIEKLTLIGTGNINATGNSLANTLTGNAGNNTLDGGTNADTMAGGAGDDIYIRDNTGDTITENPSEGTDLVQSSLTYTLGANVENLTLTGSSTITGTGNALNNTLIGNGMNNTLTGLGGDDWLDGGAGTDSLVGGTGNDTYVWGTGDTMTENANEGIDTVRIGITHTLTANFENLTLTGSSVINGTGNASNNILIGNGMNNTLTGLGGDDWLDGGAGGTDTLLGGTGNDTYVNGSGDTLTENLNEGTDTVQSDIAHTLGPNFENLTLTGTSAINGTGNTLPNVLTGNSNVNTLTGLAGNDTLRGAQGNDTLAGGTGNDTYQYDRGDGQDIVQENDSTAGNSDKVLFGATINPLDLVLSQQGNDLRIALHGSTDRVTIQNWYTGTAAQTEIIQAANGQQLLNTQVAQLIQAMATFTTQTGLTWDQGIDQQPQNVQTILAASWH